MREIAFIPARAANQRTTLSGVHSERAVMISCITNVYTHPARIHDVPSQVKLTVALSSDGREWAGQKLHSLLSAHHLIGAYFLTSESDKRMHLLTRLYGTSFPIHGWIHIRLEIFTLRSIWVDTWRLRPYICICNNTIHVQGRNKQTKFKLKAKDGISHYFIVV